MVTDISEFSYLPAQASALGVTPPPATRLKMPLPDGREISAIRFGVEAPRVTFLHGLGLNAHTWDRTILALQQPAIAIDLAGHGDSSWRHDLDYSPRTLAIDVALAIDTWTDAPQLVIGQSLGGLAGAALAAARPDLFDELIVIDITPGIDVMTGSSVLRDFYRGATDFASRDEFVDRALAFGFGGSRADTERGVHLNTRVRPDGRVEWKHHFAHLAAIEPSAPTKDDAIRRARRRESGWADLAETHAPLTLLRATRGFLSDADADEFANRLPTAEIAMIDATHNVQETAPTALGAIIAERCATSAP